MTTDEILKLIPQQHPFRFVDTVEEATESTARGSYTFKESEYFYEGHFPNHPVTPGCIITEMMTQTGVIPMAIVLLSKQYPSTDLSIFKPIFASCNMDFLAPVYPGEKILVEGKKIYYRMNKLKVEVEAINADNKKVCKGTVSGVFADITKI